MKLSLYCSKKGASEPNLVALQSEDFHALPTVLVAPLLRAGIESPLRSSVQVGSGQALVYADLARPIRRTALVRAGELGEADSRRVMQAFLLLLAR